VRKNKNETSSSSQQLGTQIVFHQAIGAVEVRALVKK